MIMAHSKCSIHYYYLEKCPLNIPRASGPYVVSFRPPPKSLVVSPAVLLVIFPHQAKISDDGDDFHNLVTLIAAVTVGTEINFDFFLFLLNASNVTNGIIFGFGLEQCSQQLEEQCWPEFSIWGHFLLRDYKGIGSLREGNQLVVVVFTQMAHKCMLLGCQVHLVHLNEALHVGLTTVWVLEGRKENRIY